MSDLINTEKRKPTTENPVVFFCTHTHWDREWYGTFQQYRYRLVRLLDRLIDLLETSPDFRCFNLDGQTVVLEDYLEVRPRQRARLEALIQSGRITIGPWYILPDEFLVSGEATIRNLQRGARICREFGVEPPVVGYLPDMFGHISQTPQILQGFGIDNAIFWRGLSGDDLPSELSWLSPDGSRVLAHHLPEYCGYSNGAFYYSAFPPEARTLNPEPHYWAMVNKDTAFAVEGLRAAIARAQKRTTSGALLLLNGIDHMEPQAEVPTILAALREAAPELDIRHATFAEFVEALRESTPADLQEIHGELRSTAAATGSYTFVLPNCLSARMHLKQMNQRAQTLLEKWAEPFDTIAAALDKVPNSADLLNESWKQLILNHPHDSICGCSVDPVHRQMESRFEQSVEIAEVLTGAALHRLAARVDSSDLTKDELVFTVFNPLNWDVTDTIQLDLDIDEDWLAARGVPVSHENIYRTFRDVEIRSASGEVVAHKVLDLGTALVHRPWIEHFVPNRAIVRLRIALYVRRLSALGWHAFSVTLPAKPRRLANRASLATGAELDNGLIWASIAPDGTITIGRNDGSSSSLAGMHWFEDGGDNGDSYTYSPPRQDRLVTSLGGPTRIEVLHHAAHYQAVAVEWDLQLPAGLTGDRQHRTEETRSHKVRSVFSLGAGMQRVDVETTITNQSRDHRLQVCFETAAITDGHDDNQATTVQRIARPTTHEAAMPFDFTPRRNTVVQPSPEQWIEDAPLERPMHGWVRCGDVALLAEGLPEYEVAIARDGRTVLKLTLLRAVNWLAAATHGNTILFGAGPHMETPDQQLLGRQFTFRYALMPIPRNNPNLFAVAQQAAQHQAIWRGVALPSAAGKDPASDALGIVPAAPNSENSLPRFGSLVRVDGTGVLLSAIKPGVQPGTVAVRAWNTTATQTALRVLWLAGPIKAAYLGNMAEDRLHPETGKIDPKAPPLIITSDGSVALPVEGRQAVTIILVLG